MSETEKNNFNILNVDVDSPEFINNTLNPASVEIGRAFGDMFYWLFSHLTHKTSKLRIQHQHDIEQYKKELDAELSKIPEENLLMPELSIVGPALESSKFYISKKILRSMFAKLISSSMNIATHDQARSCFVEIIKQLSPLDAENLVVFKNDSSLPICNYKLNTFFPKTNNSFDFVLDKHRFLSNTECTDTNLQRSSISNLIRLGLLEICDAPMLPITDVTYADFEKLPDYIEVREKFKEDNAVLLKTMTANFVIEKRQIFLTPLGLDFVSACL